jgi:hypothetical protein
VQHRSKSNILTAVTGRGCPQEDWRNQIPGVLRQDKRRREGGVRARHTRRPAHPEIRQGQEEVPDPVNCPNRLKNMLRSANLDLLRRRLPPFVKMSISRSRSLSVSAKQSIRCDGFFEQDVSGLIYLRQGA